MIKAISFSLLMIASFLCPGQKINPTPGVHKIFSLNGPITLDSLTELVHQKTNTRFSFNSSKVDGTRKIFFLSGQYNLIELLNQISKTTTLFYSYYKSYIIFTDKPLPANNSKTVRKKISPPSSGEPGEIPVNPILISSTGTKALNLYNSSAINNLLGSIKKSPAITIKYSKNIPPAAAPPKGNKNFLSLINKIHFGLGWNFALPFQGFSDYFTNTNGKSQPAFLLIPSIWFKRELNQNLNFEFHFRYAEEFYGGKSKLSDTFNVKTPQDTLEFERSILLTKLKGILANVQVNYSLNENLSIAAGAGLYFQSSALLERDSLYSKTTTQTEKSTTLEGIDKSNPDWKYMRSAVLMLNLTAQYRFDKSSIGLQLFSPVSSFANTSMNPEGVLNLQLFYRFQIN